jgi:hypothetical protein
MKIQSAFAAAALVCAAMAAAPASAAIDLSINSAAYTYQSFDASGNPIANNISSVGGDGVSNNDVSFWTATTNFNLASANDTLSITDLASDDRTVVFLNGTPIASAGIFGPGLGSFIFTPTGSAVPWTFLNNGAQSISVTGPFNVGSNTLQLIVNNTNAGIQGNLTQGPSSLFLTATVSPNGVPEPGVWALMIVGFGLAGASLRARRRVVSEA